MNTKKPVAHHPAAPSPWGRLLKPEEIDRVTAYVISIKGTTPANPKAPEGTVDTVATAAPTGN